MKLEKHETNSPKSLSHLNHETTSSQESFRQNLFFAEKILDFQSMFSSTSDDHDIRKVTREKVEHMLFAEQLHSETQTIETSNRPGPRGINQWIWEHKVLKEIPPCHLRMFLSNSMENTPNVFCRKFQYARDLLIHVSNFYKITTEQVENKHLLHPDAIRYAMEHASRDRICQTLLKFLMQKSVQSGLLDKVLPMVKNSQAKPIMHPRIVQYQLHLQERGLSRSYIRHVSAFVHQLFCWLCANTQAFSGTSPDQISVFQIQNSHLLAYRSYRLKQVQAGTCSPVTFSHHVSAVRSFYHFLKDRFGYEPPLKRFRAIKAPRYRPRDIPTDEQIEAFFLTVDQYATDPLREKIAYRFMYDLGLRLSEVAKIKWMDINLGTRSIVIHSKGKRSHVLPLAGKLYQYLQQLQHHSFSQKFLLGEKFTTIEDHLYQNFKLYAMIAGWPFPGGVHFFRHIFITRLAKKGILPQEMKELARVSRLDTVALYTQLARQEQHMINQINLLKYK